MAAKKNIKPQSERDKEMQKILERHGEKEVTKDEFSEAVRKVSQKRPPKGSRK